MNIEEIVEQAKLHFGKNRRLLKNKIQSFEFNGKEFSNWKKQFSILTSQPFIISYGVFDDVVDCLKEENYSEIDWHWLGDLSWEFKILLNKDVEKGLDWDKKLALKCGGTARIMQIYLSDIVPCFAVDIYYMTYNKAENYYEFGPIQKLLVEERRLRDKVKKFFKNKCYTFLSEKDALKNYSELYSDCNSDGNATLFDVLFSDTENYQTEIKRFNDKKLKDAAGKRVNWNEYYNKNKKFEKREEYTYFPSGSVLCTETDASNQIIKVKVWRDINEFKHREFVLDILKEYEKQKHQEKRPRKRNKF
jgi:hypothetical protein